MLAKHFWLFPFLVSAGTSYFASRLQDLRQSARPPLHTVIVPASSNYHGGLSFGDAKSRNDKTINRNGKNSG